MDVLKGLVNDGLGFDVAPLSEFDRIYLPDWLISNHCVTSQSTSSSLSPFIFVTLILHLGYSH